LLCDACCFGFFMVNRRVRLLRGPIRGERLRQAGGMGLLPECVALLPLLFCVIMLQ
jgi:hypothetical protein